MNPMAKAFWLGLERSNMFIELFSREITGKEWLLRPPGVPNSAIWTIGHLAFQRARMLELLTGQRTYDEKWVPLFKLDCESVDAGLYPEIEICRCCVGCSGKTS